MQILKDIEAARDYIHQVKKSNRKIGLTPTMGALHEGHLSLVQQSISETDISIVSIFVNPIQFNNPADLEKYPRTLDKDMELLSKVGCHAIFSPETKEMYKSPAELSVSFGELDKILEGAYRPGHFSGVGVVVSKLFNIIQPDVAYFGQKDYQQYLVINRLVRDLNFPVKVVCGEIVREANGLAMSSRNQRLLKEEKEKASLLYKMLTQAKAQIEKKSMKEIKKEVADTLANSDIRLEYFELADRSNLNLLHHYEPSIPCILLVAAYVGEVRLIDNLFV
jgi:pantoate--beta-alanine ligase